MTDCVFCRIARKEIASTVIYEDEDLFAFKDSNPQAPVHILLIPKQHCSSILEIDLLREDIPSHLFKSLKEIAKAANLDHSGFRVVANTGHTGGQTVFHLHFHILGGRAMRWPPG